MGIHKPSVIYVIYGMRKLPGLSGYVRTLDEQTIQVVLHRPDDDGPSQVMEMSRKDARLLAKRINQCLDETSSKGKYGKAGDN